jgi:type I restriction enzyme, S subunit
MELKPGYKQTEVGVIPEEWEVHPFSELLDFRNGVNADKHAYGKGVPFINVLEVITKAHLRKSDIPGRVSIARGVVDSYAVRRGDLLFNRTSETQEEVGLSSVYLDEETVVFGGFVIRGRPTNASIDATYSGYAFRAPAIRSQITAKGQGAIRANIGQADLRQVLVPLPPLPEQRAIAGVLGDVDALLGALEKLIAKKRDLKQAAMQHLLTGQTRLPGFSGEWEVRRLGDVAEIVSGGTPRTIVPTYWDGGVKWCTPTDITGTAGKFLSETERTISQAGLASCSAQLLPAGSLLLCSRATIGELKIAACEVCTNQGFKSLIARKGVSYEFLYYLLLTMKPQMVEKAIGSTFLEISKKDTASLEVSLPLFDEQTAIATVLSDMDAEIATLEARLAKTRALKQGMLQELLTGRTRLV